MISAYSDIVSHENDDWEDYLTQICLIDIFKDFIPLFKDRDALKGAIRYVAWCYSRDSDCVILGTDWFENKKRIFDKTLLPKEYFQDLVLLENRIVVKTIQRWIELQDTNTYSNLMALKDLMIEMRLSSNSSLKKTDGLTVDYDQKFKNAGYVQELGKMIDDLEQELIQNNPKLKEATRELATAKAKNTIGVETFAK